TIQHTMNILHAWSMGFVHDWDSQPQCAMCLLAHTSDLFGPYWVPNVARWWNTGCDGPEIYVGRRERFFNLYCLKFRC
ncbi:hypothetical protein EWB00_009891, partial [Schistosoma japonicum]